MRERRLWMVVALALGAFAYRSLLADALETPSADQVERWLFRPSMLPPAFVLGAAAWLTWRRADRLRALPPRPGLALALPLAALGVATFAWSLRTRALDLQLLSLAVLLPAFGAAGRGAPGLRALGLPAAVLLLGVPIPAPLRHELVWRLQHAAAAGSEWLLQLAGRGFERSGVILREGEQTFHVIDGCSGLQGIAILLLTSLLVRELFAGAGPRAWLLVAAAPPLGYALNAVRVAAIAASSDPKAYLEDPGDHTLQGLAVLAAGTAILYGMGRALSRGGAERAAGPSGPTAPLPWPAACALLAPLALLPLVLAPFQLPPRPGPAPIAFPDQGSGWVSEPLRADPYFIGSHLPGQTLYRLYEKAAAAPRPRRVELFVARETPGPPDTGHLFSSKLAWPGPEWQVLRRGTLRVASLGRRVSFALAARGSGPERALVYTWHTPEVETWRDALRALLALEASPFRRETRRSVVRLVAFSASEEDAAINQAQFRLEGFASDFREALGSP